MVKKLDKHKTTILLQPEEEVEEKLVEILKCIFWRKPELADPALKFLEEVKNNKGIKDSLWAEFCTTQSITRSNYDSIVRKLRGAGFMYKRDNMWKASNAFEKFLKYLLRVTEDWKKK